MSRILRVSGYGLQLYSVDCLLDFRKKARIRTKKMLDLFQKNHDKYMAILESKSWLAFPGIDSIYYQICFSHLNEKFTDDWKKVFDYDGYQLKVGSDNAIWIETLDAFDCWEITEYENVEEISYMTLDGVKLTNAYKVNISEGFYTVGISGHRRRLSDSEFEAGFLFSLTKNNKEQGVKDPRNDDFRIKSKGSDSIDS